MSRLQDVILRGTRAAQPLATAVVTGTLYYVTDEHLIERSTGAAWESYLDVFTGDSGAGGKKGLVPAPAAGDSGKYLRGDASWANHGISVANINLSAAQINSLNTVPITMVSAPGANAIVVPLHVNYWMTRSGNAFTANPTFGIRWNTIATDLFTIQSFTLNVAGAGETFRDILRTIYNFGYGGSDPRNKALEIYASADTTGGAGASLKVGLAYFVASF